MSIPNNPAPGREWTNDATDVTYVWDGERWFIVDNTEDVDLSGYVTESEFTADQQRQDEDIAVLEGLIKGISYAYIVDNNLNTPVSRPGQISCNTGFWSAISVFSFGTADDNGITTPTMSIGCLLYTSPSPRDRQKSRMPSSA